MAAYYQPSNNDYYSPHPLQQQPTHDNGAHYASQDQFDIVRIPFAKPPPAQYSRPTQYNSYQNDSQAHLTAHAQPSPVYETQQPVTYGGGTPYGGAGTPYTEKTSYFQPQYPGLPSPGAYSPYHGLRDQVLGRREKQHVQLTNGNLVLECPVPQSILTYAKAYGNEPDEFKSMRYTACTCDPDDFIRQKYTLRQKQFGRKTEVRGASGPSSPI
jgi:hypothetical protein